MWCEGRPRFGGRGAGLVGFGGGDGGFLGGASEDLRKSELAEDAPAFGAVGCFLTGLAATGGSNGSPPRLPLRVLTLVLSVLRPAVLAYLGELPPELQRSKCESNLR